MSRPDLRGNAGFSLIELLIAIAVLGVVLPALGAAFFVSARTVGDTADRVTSSAATTLATASFGTDVQSSLSVVAGAAPTCVPAVGTPLFYVARADGAVTWFVTDGAIGRHACLATTSTTTLPIELDTSAVLTCLPGPCSATPSQPTTVSLTYTPLEAGAVQLSATRRNP